MTGTSTKLNYQPLILNFKMDTTTTNMTTDYGFDFGALEQNQPTYDNAGACEELQKDMRRGDNLSIRFYKDNDGYACAQVESRNVSPFKVRLNPTIFTWLFQYLESGKGECLYDSDPMSPIETDAEAYKEDMLKLFVQKGKKFQWTPLFRERNGKLSGTYIAKYGKVFFYVNHSDELVDWLREMRQAL